MGILGSCNMLVDSWTRTYFWHTLSGFKTFHGLSAPHHANKDAVKPCRKSRLVTDDICSLHFQAVNMNFDPNLPTYMLLAFVY